MKEFAPVKKARREFPRYISDRCWYKIKFGLLNFERVDLWDCRCLHSRLVCLHRCYSLPLPWSFCVNNYVSSNKKFMVLNMMSIKKKTIFVFFLFIYLCVYVFVVIIEQYILYIGTMQFMLYIRFLILLILLYYTLV